MTKKADRVSDAELEILQAVWDAGTPLTYAEIKALVGRATGWEGSTIRTLILRLVEKEMLRQEKNKVYSYSPILSREEFTAQRTHSFVDKLFGGSAKNLVAALLEDKSVTKQDMEQLRSFWEDEA